MYDFSEDRALSGLLEQLKGAAVAVREGVVAEYNAAAGRLLPDLKAGERVSVPEPGVIELCGGRFEVAVYDAEGCEIYSFAAPAAVSVASALPLLENMSRAIMDNLSASFAASELIAGTAEREQMMNLARHNAILRHEQYKLLNIAENLQELCSMEGGEDVLSTSLLELDVLCRKVIDTAAALVSERGIVLEFSADSGEFIVYADARRLEKMLLSVLANSVESCAADGHISISLRKSDGQYEILVQDNGAGIPDNVFADVFEGFARPAGIGGDIRGMGLGLAVARSIALRHGGNLMLQSAEGVGTKVLMTLPATHPQKAEFHSSGVEYAANPLRPVLAAFARVLNYKYYAPPYL